MEKVFTCGQLQDASMGQGQRIYMASCPYTTISLFICGFKKNLNYSMAKGKQSHKHTNCLRCLSTRHSNDMLGFLETQPPHFYNSQSSIEGYITTVLKIWCLHMKQICNVTISKVAIHHAVFSFNPSLERSLGTARHNCSQKLTPDIMHSRVQ